MAEFALQTLVAAGCAQSVVGDGAVRVRGIRHDSRGIEPGDLFAAIPAGEAGAGRDGAQFVEDAVARGASALLCDRALPVAVPQLIASSTLVALARIARALYDDPTAQLEVIGVTGTNGKTTVAYLVESMLQAAGGRPAVIGTVNVRGPGGLRPTAHTTPMADDLMRHARWAVDTGATHVVLEVSSHGLAMHRADGVRFAVAAFTNLTQDHLDYHGDLERYGAAKARLFTELSPRRAVINIDDAFGAQLAQRVQCPVLRTSVRGDAAAELRVLSHVSDVRGLRARIATPQGEAELASPLVGEHNLENLLVVIGVGLALGLDLDAAVRGVSQAHGAPGRLERVVHSAFASASPLVLVDYAHTPDALERVLRALRPITRGKLWVVFGCGGDRDRGKRPQMGRAAAQFADCVLVTSDNPRSEDARAILDDIEPGLQQAGVVRVPAAGLGAHHARGYAMEPDRALAIAQAVRAAASNDTVLIAGKGHEAYQIIGSERRTFDDREHARVALEQRSGEAP